MWECVCVASYPVCSGSSVSTAVSACARVRAHVCASMCVSAHVCERVCARVHLHVLYEPFPLRPLRSVLLPQSAARCPPASWNTRTLPQWKCGCSAPCLGWMPESGWLQLPELHAGKERVCHQLHLHHLYVIAGGHHENMVSVGFYSLQRSVFIHLHISTLHSLSLWRLLLCGEPQQLCVTWPDLQLIQRKCVFRLDRIPWVKGILVYGVWGFTLLNSFWLFIHTEHS